MEIIGIILFCAAVMACAKIVLDPPERPKDPREDETGTVSEGMEQEPWEKRKKKLKRQWV